jgi:hypothetical protein
MIALDMLTGFTKLLSSEIMKLNDRPDPAAWVLTSLHGRCKIYESGGAALLGGSRQQVPWLQGFRPTLGAPVSCVAYLKGRFLV